MEFAFVVSAVKGAEGRLHDLFRVLFAAKTAVHLPFDELAKPGTILLIQIRRYGIGHGLKTRDHVRLGGCIGHVLTLRRKKQ